MAFKSSTLRCLSPIRTQDGNLRPCGHCKTCQCNKISATQSKVSADLAPFAQVWKIDLTYDNDNIPMVGYDGKKWKPFGAVVERYAKSKDKKLRTLLDAEYSDEKFKLFYPNNITNIEKSKYYEQAKSYSAVSGFIFYPDVAKFIKNLLREIERHLPQPQPRAISPQYAQHVQEAFAEYERKRLAKADIFGNFYYIVGAEYGYHGKRPHFHVVFATNVHNIPQDWLRSTICKIWPYADTRRLIVERVLNSDHASNYAASYCVSGVSSVGRVLPPPFRQRVRHSPTPYKALAKVYAPEIRKIEFVGSLRDTHTERKSNLLPVASHTWRLLTAIQYKPQFLRRMDDDQAIQLLLQYRTRLQRCAKQTTYTAEELSERIADNPYSAKQWALSFSCDTQRLAGFAKYDRSLRLIGEIYGYTPVHIQEIERKRLSQLVSSVLMAQHYETYNQKIAPNIQNVYDYGIYWENPDKLFGTYAHYVDMAGLKRPWRSDSTGQPVIECDQWWQHYSPQDFLRDCYEHESILSGREKERLLAVLAYADAKKSHQHKKYDTNPYKENFL